MPAVVANTQIEPEYPSMFACALPLARNARTRLRLMNMFDLPMPRAAWTACSS